MHIPHEGEIVLKEKYGSSSREILYVKPADQTNIVILDAARKLDVATWFTRIFLPQGYPDSVSKDYLAYQIWDTAQAFCSTITGTLATQEVLRGVGVGSTTATPLSATITWVIKDGCGHMGRILFAFSHGTYLDAYSKKWRLYADTLNDAAMCMEIALPLFNNYTTTVLCASTVMKAIVGVAGGATRAAMTQHHAARGNLADVAAKDAAQETAVNLVASFVALAILAVFSNPWPVFLGMVVLHVAFNYLAVRAVCLRTLNEPRFLQVIDQYLHREVIPAPCAVNATEPVIFYQLGPSLLDLKLCGFSIQLGASISHVVRRHPAAFQLASVKAAYHERRYILLPLVGQRRMYVVVKQDAETDDVLCAYFHAVLLSMLICAINDETSCQEPGTTPRPFAQVCRAVAAAEWSREPAQHGAATGLVFAPSVDLITYVDRIVAKEWLRVRNGLEQIGWDLSKHLLILDEWRIITTEINAKPISASTSIATSTADSKTSKISKTTAFDCDLQDRVPEESKTSFVVEPDDVSPLIKFPEAKEEPINPLKKFVEVEEEPLKGSKHSL